jgi:hypothetical protein
MELKGLVGVGQASTLQSMTFGDLRQDSANN